MFLKNIHILWGKEMKNSKHKLILGCASTGAKFTPSNHYSTGEKTLDEICVGNSILVAEEELLKEAEELYRNGCRYYHYHARNPITKEQTTDNEVYQSISLGVQDRCKDILISFGASRNGREVQENISSYGEWERVSQCAVPLYLGGAHFVTMQAAIELQVICDLERKFREVSVGFASSRNFLSAVYDYFPSSKKEKTNMDLNSTSKGADYGITSPMVQFQVYRNSIKARRRLGLLHEVEWVQLARSYAMTRFAIENPLMRLGGSGQLNIILLFGFSPRLPFPESYSEFRDVVKTAKSLEYDIAEPGVVKRKVTITVGAAVMPQHAKKNVKPMDVGPRKGVMMCAMRRLAAYAAQPDSQVDILRVGMEDTPYTLDKYWELKITNNNQLFRMAVKEVEENGVEIETDSTKIVQRMGISKVRDALFGAQRQSPLGEFGFPLIESEAIA